MEMDPGKLFIGGISWDTNEDQLRQYFQNFGDVVEAMIMKDRTTGRARGFGFVVFADASVAEQVVMEKHLINGRTVEAKKAVPRDDPNVLNRNNENSHGSPGLTPIRTKKIFVGGLPSTITESDFKKYFDQFGTITDVVVMYDHNTQRPRGFGFITFDSEEGVEKVLHKTFHELSGKMVEVKRAVPKELSPSRGQFGGYNISGIGRLSALPNGYIQGYNPNLVGGHGLRIDGSRLNPVTIGHSRYPLVSPSYGTGLNFDQPLSQNENANFVIGRTLNSPYGGSPSRYNNSIGYGGSSSVNNNSSTSTTNQSLWGNGKFNYDIFNPSSSNAFVDYGGEKSSMGSFDSIGSLWNSSLGIDQVENIGLGIGSRSYSYGFNDVISGTKTLGYGKSSERIGASASSYGLSNDNYDEEYKDSDINGSLYYDHTWRSSVSELENSRFLSFGLENAVPNFLNKSSGSHIQAYNVANGQSNAGIVA